MLSGGGVAFPAPSFLAAATAALLDTEDLPSSLSAGLLGDELLEADLLLADLSLELDGLLAGISPTFLDIL